MQESTETWKQRVAAARSTLDDTRLLVEFARAEQRIQIEASPAVEVMSGASLPHSSSRIGILSGSFNPLTKAHAALGRAALGAGGLDALMWCCATATIDKEGVTRATLVDRLAQLRSYTAYETAAAVAVVNRGLYVDQAALIRELAAPKSDIVVVVGFDKAVQIFDPRYYDDRDAALAKLFVVARLLVAPRAGADEGQLRSLLARHENAQYANRVAYLEVPNELRNDSSTEARTLAAHDRSGADDERLRHLLTPEGYALAMTDAPYAQVGQVADAYLWRSIWVVELARFAGTLAGSLPALPVLVAASMRVDEIGAELRQLLRQSEGFAEPDVLLKALELASRGH